MRRVITLFVLFLTLGLVRSANAQNIITTVAGGGPNNVPAVSANINPEGVAVDAAGNLFIADIVTHHIFKVDMTCPPPNRSNSNVRVGPGIGRSGWSRGSI